MHPCRAQDRVFGDIILTFATPRAPVEIGDDVAAGLEQPVGQPLAISVPAAGIASKS